MSTQNSSKGFTYGIAAIIFWAVTTVANLLRIPFLGTITGIIVLVLGIMAYVTGKKEYAADTANSKAKTGKTIGLIIIVLDIITVVAFFAAVL
ncbi:MAG: hypothetical protein Q4C55_04905 [Eubacterium sp.]|nr:hypothetical protein [Eubacterium sp.]